VGKEVDVLAENDPSSSSGPEGKGNDLKQQWDRLAKWQKAGVIIGGFAAVIGLGMYLKTRNSGSSSSSSPTSQVATPASSYSSWPGSGEIYPPVTSTTTTITPVTSSALLAANTSVYAGGPDALNAAGQPDRWWYNNGSGQQLLTARSQSTLPSGMTPVLPVGTNIYQVNGQIEYQLPGSSSYQVLKSSS
jgi:hypothetical protein